jgi:hypothetical protein
MLNYGLFLDAGANHPLGATRSGWTRRKSVANGVSLIPLPNLTAKPLREQKRPGGGKLQATRAPFALQFLIHN